MFLMGRFKILPANSKKRHKFYGIKQSITLGPKDLLLIYNIRKLMRVEENAGSNGHLNEKQRHCSCYEILISNCDTKSN